MTFESSVVLNKQKSRQVSKLWWIWFYYLHVDQWTITLVSAAALRNVAEFVIHDVDLRQFGRHYFKRFCFAFGVEAERASRLYTNVHTVVLIFGILLVLVLIPWPLPTFPLHLCHACHLLWYPLGQLIVVMIILGRCSFGECCLAAFLAPAVEVHGSAIAQTMCPPCPVPLPLAGCTSVCWHV